MALLVGQVPGKSSEWGFEFKWDGIRALTFFDGRAAGGADIFQEWD